MAFVRWGVALAALAVAAVVAVGSLTGPAGDRPAPIEVAGSAVPGGDGTLREVVPPRLVVDGAGTGATEATLAGATEATTADQPAATTSVPDASGSTTSSIVPGLGTMTEPVTDPLAALLAALPLVGTTTTTVSPATTTPTTLLPGLPPLPLPPLPTLPLLPPLGG